MFLQMLTQGPLLLQAPLMSPSIEVQELIISIIGGGRRLREPSWEWNQLKQLPLTHENECALLREHQYECRTTLDDWRDKKADAQWMQESQAALRLLWCCCCSRHWHHVFARSADYLPPSLDLSCFRSSILSPLAVDAGCIAILASFVLASSLCLCLQQ